MRRAGLGSLLGAALALTGSVSAFAQAPTPPTTPTPAPQPAPPPAPPKGSLTIKVSSRTELRGRPYVLTGDVVTVTGVVKPYVARQHVRVRISTAKRKPTLVRALVRKGGTFKVRFRTRRAVRYTIYARHNRTAQQGLFAAKLGLGVVSPGQPMAVALLKQGMRALGYPAGNGPYVTGKLQRSILAFRKTNSMARTFEISRGIYEMVFAGRGAFKLRFPKEGKHVEADISRQVLALAEGDKVVATYPTSSGAPATPTILGHYHFYLKAPGTNAKGMYMSNYFIRGYAIHGYPSVPTYNASHGCLRVPNADAVAIFNWIRVGDPIWVYP
jgi:lipoprotein-anchoring transpeptidase ErfK/SrfK